MAIVSNTVIREVHLSGANDLEQLRSYGKLLRSGSVLSTRIKLCICGSTDSGKTSLLASLRKSQLLSWSLWEKRPSTVSQRSAILANTRGIAVSTLRVRDGGEYNAFDLPGDSEFADMLPMFIDPETSIFIVVCDLRDPPLAKLTHIRHWLTLILAECSYRYKPCVVLVGSHMDEASEPMAKDQIMFETLREEYAPFMTISREHAFIDCRVSSADAFTRLRSILDEQRYHLMPYIKMIVPKVVDDIVLALNSYHERLPDVKWMTWQSFFKEMRVIPSVAHESEETIRAVSRFLHSIGELVFVEGTDGNEFVVLDVNWICQDVIGWILAPSAYLEASKQAVWLKFRKAASIGGVKRSMIPKLAPLDNPKSIDSMSVVVSMDYAFKIDAVDEPSFYFPSLLETKEPANMWMPDSKYKYYLGIKLFSAHFGWSLPASLFFRAAARLCRKYPNFTLWKDGLWVMTPSKTEALVFISVETKAIYISTRDKLSRQAPRDLLREIQHVFTDLSSHSPGLQMDIEHASVGHLRVDIREPATYSRDAILDALIEGRDTITHPDAKMNMADPVDELLGVTLEGWLFVSIN